MKKAISVLIVLCMSVSLVACGSKDSDSDTSETEVASSETTTEEVTTTEAEEIQLVRTIEDGRTFFDCRGFKQCLVDTVELTCDNWKEYFEPMSVSYQIYNFDAFGDIESTDTYDEYVLTTKSEYYYCYYDVIIELKNIETQEVISEKLTDSWGLRIDESFDISKYECTRIQGEILYFDLPEEAFTSPMNNRDLGIYVGYSDEDGYFSDLCMPVEIAASTKVMNTHGLFEWLISNGLF